MAGHRAGANRSPEFTRFASFEIGGRAGRAGSPTEPFSVHHPNSSIFKDVFCRSNLHTPYFFSIGMGPRIAYGLSLCPPIHA